jgi:hypothetical protein
MIRSSGLLNSPERLGCYRGPRWVSFGLPISAGVAIYVGATDLVPEVNREPGIRIALVFFLGVGSFLLLRSLLPAQ